MNFYECSSLEIICGIWFVCEIILSVILVNNLNFKKLFIFCVIFVFLIWDIVFVNVIFWLFKFLILNCKWFIIELRLVWWSDIFCKVFLILRIVVFVFCFVEILMLCCVGEGGICFVICIVWLILFNVIGWFWLLNMDKLLNLVVLLI